MDSVPLEYWPSQLTLLLFCLDAPLFCLSHYYTLKAPVQNQDRYIWKTWIMKYKVECQLHSGDTQPQRTVSLSSVIYVLKSMGEGIEPCGTPKVKFHLVDSASLVCPVRQKRVKPLKGCALNNSIFKLVDKNGAASDIKGY